MTRRVGTAITLGLCALLLASCGDEGSPAPEVEGDGGGSGVEETPCPTSCPAGLEELVDSAAACGFRCVAPGEVSGDPLPPERMCPASCPEGTVRRVSPQEECGFVCEVAALEAPQTIFVVEIENVSGSSGLPTGLSPGAWALHTGAGPLYAQGVAPSPALAAMVSEGEPGSLVAAAREQAGVLTAGTFGAGGLAPGAQARFTVEVEPEARPRLSLLTMFTSSNDAFLATPAEGQALFDASGAPLASQTVLLGRWDGGVEANERPGQGPSQPGVSPRGAGRREGRIGRYLDTTQALAPARQLAQVQVVEVTPEGGVTIQITAAASGPSVSGQGPIFYTTHAAGWRLFTAGMPASSALGAWAASLDPSALLAELAELDTIGDVGASPGVVEPGEAVEIEVVSSAAHPWLTLAAPVVESNDTFWASAAVRLRDEGGQVRSAEAIQADLRALALWDAGVEANQLPGAGDAQPPRQATPDQGDPGEGAVRAAEADRGAGFAELGGVLALRVVPAEGGALEVTLEHQGSGQAIQLSSLVWALHSDEVALFEDGGVASPALAALAQEGEASPLLAELAGAGEAVAGVGEVSAESGGLAPGESITFVVTPDAEHPWLSLAARLTPGNDAFVALAPGGLRLLEGGALRDAEALAAEGLLYAWDAGVEQNEGGALGAHQAPGAGGEPEGDGRVRALSDGWWYPEAEEVIRVTITPGVR